MLKINETKKENVGAGALKSAQRGITLIALIITIIVMLILVGVTITVAVNGGLFTAAGRAGKETQNAIDKEQELANGKIEVDGKWYNSIDDYIAGKYEGYVPTYAEASKDTNDYLTEKATYSDGVEINPAVIPAGYKIINDGEKIANGIVIADSNNNEFVWIPVKKAIVTESEIEKIIADSGNAEMTPVDAVQSLADSGIYPMAVQVGTDYKGILYNFTHNEDNTLTLKVNDWTDNLSNREPAVLPDYDTQANFMTYGLGTYSDSLYQNAYNKMVQSVAKNGGFYVGRYEISTGTYTDADNNTITYAQSKKNQTALVSVTWYEMYKYERNYAKYNTSLGVTSEMIWGSQWDQMMIFVNGKNDGVGAKFYVAGLGSNCSGDSSIKTGMNPADQVANIFDLKASRMEWTQEAISSNYRVRRGGSYNGVFYVSTRYHVFYYDPTVSNSDFSSRASLYIK